MKRIITTLVLVFVLTSSFSQTRHKISSYLGVQYNKTLYDYTAGNNPWGIGLGLQTLFNNHTKFKPAIELTGVLYLEDDKVFRSDPGGSFLEKDNDVRGMINLFGGSSFHPNQDVFLSILAGPSFIGKNTYLGIKPSFGLYFSKNQRWTGKVSYLNIFNRTKIVNDDFGSVIIAIGCKLF